MSAISDSRSRVSSFTGSPNKILLVQVFIITPLKKKSDFDFFILRLSHERRCFTYLATALRMPHDQEGRSDPIRQSSLSVETFFKYVFEGLKARKIDSRAVNS